MKRDDWVVIAVLSWIFFLGIFIGALIEAKLREKPATIAVHAPNGSRGDRIGVRP